MSVCACVCVCVCVCVCMSVCVCIRAVASTFRVIRLRLRRDCNSVTVSVVLFHNLLIINNMWYLLLLGNDLLWKL